MRRRLDRTVPCPTCGGTMQLWHNGRAENGRSNLYYSCTRWPHCDTTQGATMGGDLMGVPGGKETRAERERAHQVFNRWRVQYASGRGAYRALQALVDHHKLGIERAHFASMTRAQCQQVIALMEQTMPC